jgi:hypothetical protein
VEPPVQQTRVPQRVAAAMRMAQHAARLVRQRANRVAKRDRPPMHRLARNAAHRPAGNRRHGAQQSARAGMAVQDAGDPRHSPGQLRLYPGHGARHSGKRPP